MTIPPEHHPKRPLPETQLPGELGGLASIHGHCVAVQDRTLLPATAPAAPSPKSALDTPVATWKLSRGRARSQRCWQRYTFWKCFFKTNIYSSHSAASYKCAQASSRHGCDLKQRVEVDLPFLDSKKPASVSRVPQRVQPREIPMFSLM